MDQHASLFDWPEEGVRRTPYLIYSDTDVYEAEMARIFRGRTWHYLALEVEIPNPGDYRLMDVGDTSVIVVRTPDGGINAMVNRCAHKGSMLLYQPFGNVGELVQC